MYSLRKRLSLLAILATSSLCTSNYAFSQIWIEECQRTKLPRILVAGALVNIIELTYSKAWEVQACTLVYGYWKTQYRRGEVLSSCLLDISEE